MFDIRQTDLQRLNTLTKYPSIPTYHTLDPKNGGLLPETVCFDGDVVATEKIDGTNARLICLPDGSYVLGSREELLYARGDLIGNPALGIVEAFKPLAESLAHPVSPSAITVFYAEVYGGKVTGASKQYTGNLAVGFRLFDVVVIDDWAERLAQDARDISAWRDAGGQRFLDEMALAQAAATAGFALTPRVATLPADALPTGIEAMHEFLKTTLPATLSALDDDAGRRPEGFVLRTADRRVIAKARFDDYERTAKRRKA
jgi:hypothetical protein